ncbi:TetR/AcrR family transcriptional regulator [Nocardioides gansuensis]|uniref:TetR/AcrR family transcriptional regulator n=1 Tax=Nocardioides gansuensis TaxID=2138300 RepID=A0A2T8F7S2_9ACTN|nr:TetR/AcrR family transcriptional regulator [Nocardioides gansuensis]PVG81766.1 TetR/AcrR family transcriptional regulator [Nocardioides gansuensis]
MTTATGRTRLSPDERRTQLLELGTDLLSRHGIDAITIDLLADEAGVSRGLLYHYFGSLQGFREAVVRHAVDQLVAETAPPAEGEPLERLFTSVGVYVDYVRDNYAGYVSLVRAAAGGTDVMREIYEEGRHALIDRVFREDAQGEIIPDTPVTRLLLRGWAAMAEEVVVTWAADPGDLTRDRVVELLALSLPTLVELA